MTDQATPLQQFAIEVRAPGYWRVTFANPPINLLNSTTVLELAEIARRIEAAEDLKVVVFASENPEFWMARYDLSDTNPVAFAPTAVACWTRAARRAAVAGETICARRAASVSR